MFLSAHGSAGILPGVFQVLGACWDGKGSCRDGDGAREQGECRMLVPQAATGCSLLRCGAGEAPTASPCLMESWDELRHSGEMPRAAQTSGTRWPGSHQLCLVPALWGHRENNQGVAEEHPALPCACCSPALTCSLGMDQLPVFSLPDPPPCSRIGGVWHRAPPKP